MGRPPTETPAILAHPEDNCALATRNLQAGEVVRVGGAPISVSTVVPTGHRFAFRDISVGESLLSWRRPFGTALRTLRPGTYLCNAATLEELRSRDLDWTLPEDANFADLDSREAAPSSAPSTSQVQNSGSSRIFRGFPREGDRGVGTRNFIVLIGTGPVSCAFVRRAAQELHFLAEEHDHVDGLVPVAHTEGGARNAHNHALLCRTLAGFLVHPNCGAVFLVSSSTDGLQHEEVIHFAQKRAYPLEAVPCGRLTLAGSFSENLGRTRSYIEGVLPRLAAAKRAERPLSDLKLALQCGGSDAFSGVSANPLVGAIAREVIADGGIANLAETLELVGAEEYVLQRVRNQDVASTFLHFVEAYKKRMRLHGHSPESNPSGGNRFRGLYNITLKSLGAAMKKDPRVRLDYAIDYGERMLQSGFYFMNSPGNDLESVAGQVAAGSNLIFFTTGNGSITNFPFVPTLKVMSTSSRFDRLRSEMDIDAGQILLGRSLEQLAESALDLTLRVASGEPCKGELAGHHQVSLWRNWALEEESEEELVPLQVSPRKGYRIKRTHRDSQVDEVIRKLSAILRRPHLRRDLILPTSLCSSEVAAKIASRLSREGKQVVSLSHTEGCGASGGENQDLLLRLLEGYAAHPLARHVLFLEHGCEKVHNSLLRRYLEKSAIEPDRFGWASIQGDGGLQEVEEKIRRWFAQQTSDDMKILDGNPILSIQTAETVDREQAETVVRIMAALLDQEITLLLAEKDPLLSPGSPLLERLPDMLQPNADFGRTPGGSGLQIMQSPSEQVFEIQAGLGAAGTRAFLMVGFAEIFPGHPFIPSIQIETANQATPPDEFDLVLSPKSSPRSLLLQLAEILANPAGTVAGKHDYVSYQVPRGRSGVSV